MKNILARVDLRVRSTAPVDADRGFEHLGQNAFDHFLYPDSGRLPLPAVVVETFVGDMEKEALDGVKL